MISPITAIALADALRDERRPAPQRPHRTTRSPLRARLAGALHLRTGQPVANESGALS